MRTLAALLLAVCASAVSSAPTTAQALDSGWEFRLAPSDALAAAHANATVWHRAQVPGNVHTDLLATGLIRDPYIGAPEGELQWIGLAQWEYRTTFEVDAAALKRAHHALVFEGLDTFAHVELNGKKLLDAENAFRTWRVPIEGLRPHGNTLRVVFDSPIKRLLPQVEAMPLKLPGNYPSPYGDELKDAMTGNFVRKPGYHYGWDWGPRYVTAGIWRAVKLESWDALRLSEVHVRQRALDPNTAALEVALSIDSDRAVEATIEVAPRDPDGKPLSAIKQAAHLRAGSNTITLPVSIAQPRRWWPSGQGEQALYTFSVRVSDARGIEAEQQQRIGLRTVELSRDKDGQGFSFIVNGVPVFAKGANAIPFDAFPARATLAQQRRVLESARDANMNMIRLWGGGYYESDAFYDLCDELGLMVWQDFMFGGGVVPAYDQAFRANVIAEAHDNVRRLRRHPSLVLWNGNNEEETAWKHWGYGETLRKADPAFADKVWSGYVQLFGHDLREVVAQEGDGVPYWASSPSNDLTDTGGGDDADHGDMHYWHVWGNPALPASAYLDVTPRFMSEYGLQAWPSLRTIDSFAAPAEQGVDTPVIRAHQKFLAGAGNERLMQYVEREYGKPRDFAEFVYLSQLVQAEGIELAALHHRASRPRTMGSLYWQLNDVWPGASWSSIDWYGRWKALQFHARRFYAPLAVAALRKAHATHVSLINDRTESVAVQWRLRVLDFDGKSLRDERKNVALAPQSAAQVATFTDADLLRGGDPKRTMAVVDLLVDGKPVSRSEVYFDVAKNLAWRDVQIKTELAPNGDGHTLTLNAKSLARGVWIDFGAVDAELSDNALTLLPGETRTLQLRSPASLAQLQQALHVRALRAPSSTSH
jgi:beta-mannosidase